MEYRKLEASDITLQLFAGFERHQQVTKCWRKIDGVWLIKDIAFTEQWSEQDYIKLVDCLENTVNTHGVVYGAFDQCALKGFVSVEGKPFGTKQEYVDLSCIHVSEDMRGHGIGKKLFSLAAHWAKNSGAHKLYISTHSAVESQAFYRVLGCVEAVEYSEPHIKMEPDDCQLEYLL